MGQAGSQMRGQQGPSMGAHAGTVLEDSPSDQLSSSRGFLCGCWSGGSTHWSFLFFLFSFGSVTVKNARHSLDSEVARLMLSRSFISLICWFVKIASSSWQRRRAPRGFLHISHDVALTYPHTKRCLIHLLDVRYKKISLWNLKFSLNSSKMNVKTLLKHKQTSNIKLKKDYL